MSCCRAKRPTPSRRCRSPHRCAAPPPRAAAALPCSGWPCPASLQAQGGGERCGGGSSTPARMAASAGQVVAPGAVRHGRAADQAAGQRGACHPALPRCPCALQQQSLPRPQLACTASRGRWLLACLHRPQLDPSADGVQQCRPWVHHCLAARRPQSCRAAVASAASAASARGTGTRLHFAQAARCSQQLVRADAAERAAPGGRRRRRRSGWGPCCCWRHRRRRCSSLRLLGCRRGRCGRRRRWRQATGSLQGWRWGWDRRCRYRRYSRAGGWRRWGRRGCRLGRPLGSFRSSR